MEPSELLALSFTSLTTDHEEEVGGAIAEVDTGKTNAIMFAELQQASFLSLAVIRKKCHQGKSIRHGAGIRSPFADCGEYQEFFRQVDAVEMPQLFASPPPAISEDRCSKLQAEDTAETFRDMTKSNKHPSQLPSFLRLPGELRNRIYQYALCEPTGIFYRERRSSPGYLKPGLCLRSEYNQLKYVCRQLYTEAAGLELKYNDIIFHYDLPGHHALLFLDFCTPSRNSWLSSVILLSRNSLDSAYTIAKIVRFCKQNPDVSVKYICQHFRFLRSIGDCYFRNRGYVRFIEAGVFLSFAFRAVDLSAQLQYEFLGNRGKAIARNWREWVQIEALHAPNFRIWPEETELNEEMIKKLRMHAWVHYREMDESHIEMMIERARDWVENGI